MALFQFLGKHSKKDKISFSFEPIKRCELPNEFCFHIVVFCAGFLSQCLGGLSQGQVLLVLYFSTSHVIPHIRALVPCPGLTSEVCVVASTSVPLTPTEILSEYFPRASGT